MATRVLVVDDEPKYCTMLSRVLEREGFAVSTLPDGASAVERLLTGDVDLLVTDLDMPGLTGADLAELATRLPRAPGVLVITAQKALLEETMQQLRGVQCLLKPFTLDDFRAKVGVLTGRWSTPPSDKEGEAPHFFRHLH